MYVLKKGIVKAINLEKLNDSKLSVLAASLDCSNGYLAVEPYWSEFDMAADGSIIGELYGLSDEDLPALLTCFGKANMTELIGEEMTVEQCIITGDIKSVGRGDCRIPYRELAKA